MSFGAELAAGPFVRVPPRRRNIQVPVPSRRAVKVSSVAPAAPWRWKKTSTGASDAEGGFCSASGVADGAGVREAVAPPESPQPARSRSAPTRITTCLTTGTGPPVRQASVLTDRVRRYT